MADVDTASDLNSEFVASSSSKWPYITAVVIVVLFIYYKYCTWNFDTFTKMGIKGPKPWFGLGNFATVFKMGVMKFDLEMKKKYGPIHGVFLGRQPFLMICDTAMLKQIMIKDFHIFPNHMDLGIAAPPLDKILSFLKDDHWKFVRSVMTPTFSSGKMRKMCDQINNCCRTMCENLKIEAENKQMTNLKSICEAYTMDTTSSVAFGVTLDSHNDPNNIFVRMARKVFEIKMTPGMMLLFVAPFLLKPLRSLGVPLFITDHLKFFEKVVQKAIEHRDEVNDKKHLDFLQLLLNAHKDTGDDDDDEDDGDKIKWDDKVGSGGSSSQKSAYTAPAKRALSDEDLLAQSLLFFLVGFETTSVTLTFFAYNMACYPNEQEKLYEEIVEKIGDKDPTYDSIKPLTYLNMCLNETLRMFPFGVRTDRVAAQDVTINGLFIPKGMLVGIPIYVLHNDPEFWPEPHVFNPERFSPENWNPSTSDPLRFMPFGAGPRNCVGMRLAKMEVKMAVVHMIRNFRFSATEETERPPVFERFTLRTVNPLKIKVEKR